MYITNRYRRCKHCDMEVSPFQNIYHYSHFTRMYKVFDEILAYIPPCKECGRRLEFIDTDITETTNTRCNSCGIKFEYKIN